MANLFKMLFGCRHKRCSFPLTTKPGQRRLGTASITGTYFVCLHCGTEFAYDLSTMKVVDAQLSSMKVAQSGRPCKEIATEQISNSRCA